MKAIQQIYKIVNAIQYYIVPGMSYDTWSRDGRDPAMFAIFECEHTITVNAKAKNRRSQNRAVDKAMTAMVGLFADKFPDLKWSSALTRSVDGEKTLSSFCSESRMTGFIY